MSRTLLADINRMPTSESCHAVRRGMRRLMPRATQNAPRMAAETRVRRAPTSGGARCSPATWMARYVEPQIKYTQAKANTTRVFSAELWGIRLYVNRVTAGTRANPCVEQGWYNQGI